MIGSKTSLVSICTTVCIGTRNGNGIDIRPCCLGRILHIIIRRTLDMECIALVSCIADNIVVP